MKCTFKKKTSRSIKNSLKHCFSGYLMENLNLIEDTWQTQHKRSQTYAMYNFMAKKTDTVQIKIVSRSLTRTQTKKSVFQKRKRSSKRAIVVLMEMEDKGPNMWYQSQFYVFIIFSAPMTNQIILSRSVTNQINCFCASRKRLTENE